MSRFTHSVALPAVLILATAGSMFLPVNASAATAKMHHRRHQATMKNASMTAKVSETDARATALASVPGGTVVSEKLETVHGKLVYHYLISRPGTSRVQKVNVDADNGKIVAATAHMHRSTTTRKEDESRESKKP